MAQSQIKAGGDPHRLNWARIVLTAFGTLLVMGLVGWDEVALGGPIIFLVETLGFGAGLSVFILTWVAIGFSMLLFADFIWPSLKPLWQAVVGWAKKQWEKYSLRVSIVVTAVLIAAAYVGFRYYLLYTAIALAAVVFVGSMEMIRQLADRWVRSIDPRKGRRLRWIGALVAIVILGPVFAWTLLKWLEFNRSAVYGLTIPAAIIFGTIWVPFYGLGVWNLGLSRVF